MMAASDFRPLDAARDSLIAAQAQLIMMLAERNSALEVRIGELESRLARLERAASRNSANSSMPPSADDLPGKTPPPPRKPREGRNGRQGKQPSAPGAHLAWSHNPDTTVPLFPQGACACGRDLAGAADLGIAASHQVIDTPVATATVTQYEEHTVACPCGRLHAAPPPAGAGEAGTVTYGLNIQAWCVFLLAVHHVPVERCARLLLECLDKREADVLRFLTDLQIPPTSNQAERDLRPAKMQQKISGRLRSETAARHRYAIRGYTSTAAKHGQNMITVIRDALAGHPWAPAIPA